MLTSKRPYMVRALYEWIADNDLTPYLLVDAAVDGVMVPAHAVQNDRVVLNVGVQAVDKLQLGNQLISFDARFNGRVENISVPLSAVLAIYARENGVGMAFDADEGEAEMAEEVDAPLLAPAAELDDSKSGSKSLASSSNKKAKSEKIGLRLVK